MNAPVRATAPRRLIVLELLFVALELAVGALNEVLGAGGLVSQARDLQDAITSCWRSIDEPRDDELPF